MGMRDEPGSDAGLACCWEEEEEEEDGADSASAVASCASRSAARCEVVLNPGMGKSCIHASEDCQR